MRTLLKILGGVLLAVLALVLGGVSYLALRKPASRPTTSAPFEATPARLARGEYLVLHVSDCLDCHSDHLNSFDVPIKPGTEGQGGFPFRKEFGVPGLVCAQNITPDADYGLGNWTDDEIMRAIREGVDRNGDALFPMMPYVHFAHMSDEDAKSVVVYLRTLQPIHRSVPPRSIDFPVNLMIKFVPKPITHAVPQPDEKDNLKYGEYLTHIGGCIECHTPHDDKGRLIESKPFAGGWTMIGPWGRVVTSNLTPSKDSYIGRATREEFIGRFHAFATMNADNAPQTAKGRNTIMPWLALSHMTDHDLGAIYDYLKTLKPIEGKINSFPDADANVK